MSRANQLRFHPALETVRDRLKRNDPTLTARPAIPPLLHGLGLFSIQEDKNSEDRYSRRSMASDSDPSLFSGNEEKADASLVQTGTANQVRAQIIRDQSSVCATDSFPSLSCCALM